MAQRAVACVTPHATLTAIYMGAAISGMITKVLRVPFSKVTTSEALGPRSS